MSKELIQLSKDLLGKFQTRRGPVMGRFAVDSETLKTEIKQLAHYMAGQTWATPIAGRALEFVLDGDYYIALTTEMREEQLESIVRESHGWLSPTSLPGATFLHVADKLQLKPSLLDPQSVEEFIEGPANDVGIPLNVLKEYLEPHQVFRLAAPVSNSPLTFTKATYQYVANYISTFDSILLMRNRLSNTAIAQIREFFLEEKEQLFVENFFSAMSTPHLPHAFLEIYRTLEFAFVLPRASALLKRIDSGGKLGLKVLEFARVCHRELGWKRVERDALKRLVSDYIAQNRGAFATLCQTCQPFRNLVTPSVSAEAKEQQGFMNDFVEVYYNLRNQVAHQFWADEIKTCTDADWQALIEFTLGCALHTYNKHLVK